MAPRPRSATTRLSLVGPVEVSHHRQVVGVDEHPISLGAVVAEAGVADDLRRAQPARYRFAYVDVIDGVMVDAYRVHGQLNAATDGLHGVGELQLLQVVVESLLDLAIEVADDDGVVVVPGNEAAIVLEASIKRERIEQRIKQEIRSGANVLEAIDTVLSREGCK